ncbi:MAG: VanW family protein [Candidatus Berkelbacteria bacterium]
MTQSVKKQEKIKSKDSRANFMFYKIGIILFGLIMFFVIVYAVFNLIYSQTVFAHTYIGGVDVSNKTLTQVKEVLSQNFDQIGSKVIEVKVGDKNFKIKSTDIDREYNLDKSVELAWSVGRKGNLAKIFKEQIWSVFGSNRYPLVFSYSQDKLDQKVKAMAQETDQPEQDATIQIINLVPQVVSEKIGQRLNQDQAKDLILANFGNFSTSEQVQLTIETVKPKILAAQAESIIGQTKKVLDNEIVVTGRGKSFTLKSKDIVNLIDFKPGQDLVDRNYLLVLDINQEKMKKYLEGLAKEIDQPAKDAKFAVVNGKVSAFQAAQTGYELDQEKAIMALTDAILNSKDKVELKISEIKPEISSSSDANGIKELVGEGTTSWRGSTANRVHNLTLGANNISGHIVKPGEEFSTVKALGPIDLESGFRKELVIKNSTEVAPEVGGGLCQVSTTLFRAAMNAGLKITARTNHSFRVSYYEPPVGMDATIYDPKPDFKFVNTMKTPILIWAVPSENGLTFQIYGTKDGRKSEVSTPVLFDYVSPGDTVYRETDTMETGAMRLVERATRGVTASFTYKVHDASGNVLEDDKFVSKYVPVPETYLVGPGTQIPPAE